MEQKCENCRFYRKNMTYDECHFGPPSVVADQGGEMSCWPDTKLELWCGKWEPIKAEMPEGETK